MPRKKLQSTASRPAGKAASDEMLDLTNLPPAKMVVPLPEHANRLRNLDFAKHYGNGCDVVVYAAQRAMDRMVRACAESGGKTLSAVTIASYYSPGLTVFLAFCATMASALGRELRLDDVDRQFIDHFIAHLRQSGGSLCDVNYFDRSCFR